MDLEKVKALLPRQYVGKWKNDEGIVFNVIQYVDNESLTLTKIFIPSATYRNLEVKTFLGKVVLLSLEDDEEGRATLKGIELDTKAV